ncbi:MAG: CPBP family intramembrane glutamic endopeptidase [Pseudomonadota bacterium]
MAQSHPVAEEADAASRFVALSLGGIAVGVIGVILTFLLHTNLVDQISFSLREIAAGLAAVAPPGLCLIWFANTKASSLARFRRSQAEFFSSIGFRFTWLRIICMATIAGVGEEILFRGAIQPWFATLMPMAFALILSNVIFGALHWRTIIYAVVAGVVGLYLGALALLTGGLIAPIITHTVYDILALAYARWYQSGVLTP